MAHKTVSLKISSLHLGYTHIVVFVLEKRIENFFTLRHNRNFRSVIVPILYGGMAVPMI